MRAVAVLLVVLYHLDVLGVRGGFVGVDVFFVLSGYLITGLLLAEARKNGRISLLQFYARRARRLLPAAILVVLTTLAAGWVLLSPLEQLSFSRSALAASAYWSNIRYMHAPGGYFATGLHTDPLLHTWSLAVEEQFYLVWPLLLLLAFRGSRRNWRLGAVILAVICASSLGFIWLNEVKPTSAFFGSAARAWEFGFGALAALLPAAAFVTSRVALRVVGWLGLIAVVAAALLARGVEQAGAQRTFPVFLALASAGAVLVLIAGRGDRSTGVSRLLAIRPLQWIGELSYSWYLWHWPVLILAIALYPTLSVSGRVVCGIVSLAIAAVTHHVLENPVRFHPRLVARPWLSLSLAACLTVLGVGAALVAKSVAGAESRSSEHLIFLTTSEHKRGQIGCREWPAPDAEAVPCKVSGGEAPTTDKPTVVLFGDSHAAQWIAAFEPLAVQGWRFMSITKPLCPSADISLEASFDSCLAWRRDAIAYIKNIGADVVVLTNSTTYLNANTRVRVTGNQWRDAYRRTISSLQAAGMGVLLIRDTPRMVAHIPICLSRGVKQKWLHALDCDLSRVIALDSTAFRAEQAAVAGFRGAQAIDMSEHFCDESRCYAERNGMIVFWDSNHITRPYAARLARILGIEVEQTRRKVAGNIEIAAAAFAH